MTEGHSKAGQSEDIWKGFQQYLGYSDAEIEHFKKDPKKFKAAPIMVSPKMRKSTMVIEVVKSHGCGEGMKVGDKLYFKGIGRLDTKRSSNWCAYALAYTTAIAYCCHSLMVSGIDPNEMYTQYFSCFDCGPEHGWGQVIMKAYVIDESNVKK